MPVDVLVALGAKSYEILCQVVPQVAPPLNVMDLKTFHPPTPLATPAISLQDFMAELTISFKVKLQAWSFRTNAGQSVTWILSRSRLICGLGRPSTSRVSAGRRASWLPVSELTPARKSAQIISKQ